MIWKLVISGVGGQGIISAGILLAETAVIHEGRHAVQSQTYGAEMRGGVTRTDVTISDESVLYPKVDQAHVLACMHVKAISQFYQMVRPGGLLISDRDEAPIPRRVDCRQVELPLIAAVREETGSERGANLCLLGAMAEITKVVSLEALEEAVKARYGTRDTNVRALNLGRELALASGVQSHLIKGESPSSGRHATSARL